jgi:hypothetical protein
MFAWNRRRGSRGSWCATQAMIHSLSWASPLSFRDRVPGEVARGHVWMIASSRQIPAVSDQCERKWNIRKPRLSMTLPLPRNASENERRLTQRLPSPHERNSIHYMKTWFALRGSRFRKSSSRELRTAGEAISEWIKTGVS